MVLKTGLAYLRNGVAAVVIAVVAVPAFVDAASAQQRGPESVADLAEGLLDAVVNISTSQNIGAQPHDGPTPVPKPQVPEGSPFQEFFDDFFGPPGQNPGDQSRKVQSLGSGFVIDAEQGIIVTNNHVIADADEIEANFSDGSKLKAELVGKDLKTDLAVLKVDPSKRKLTAVKFGDSETARIGDWVMAIGNPFGLGGTVTVGIVSARNRDINSGPYDNFIQTDAAINRGNSGGPLFDMNGEVIGINTAIISPSGGSIGIGFAIPSELAVSVINQLREFGETRRGWLGVRIQPVTDDIAESLGMKGTKGALVAGIIKGGPVDNGVIEAGDVITHFGGKAINDARDLPRIVAESPVGEEVDVVLRRKGKEMNVKIKLGRLEDGEQVAETEHEEGTDQQEQELTEVKPVLGMNLAVLDDETRARFEIAADVEGVVVTEVDPGSAAAEKRIEPGEVIVDIGQETVETPEDVADRVQKLRDEGRKNALLMLASKTGELRFVTVRID
ncbi:MAG: DegQ family serine endoprotease [Phyllobacterium sp.]